MAKPLHEYGVIVGGVDVSLAVVSGSWGGSLNEIADKLTVRLGVHPTRASDLDRVVNVAGLSSVEVNGAQRFVGVDFVVEAADEPSLSAYDLVAYDPLSYLMRDQEALVTTEEMDARALVQLICETVGVNIVANSLPAVRFGPKVFNVESPVAIFQYIMDTASYLTGEQYFLRWDGGLHILSVTGGSVLAELTPSNSEQVKNHRDIDDLVTQVRMNILGWPLSETGIAVNPLVPTNPQVVLPPINMAPQTHGTEGDLGANRVESFGRIQKVLDVANFFNPSEATQIAAETLRVFGKPHAINVWRAYDVPELRKGDKISARVGSTNGTYTATGVEHDMVTNTMLVSSDNRALEHVRIVPSVSDPAGQPFIPAPELPGAPR